jgi:hypothetical protein
VARRPPSGADAELSAPLVEIVRLGAAARANAFDPATLTEVAVVAPASLSDAELARLAVAKLRRALSRRTGVGNEK